MAIKMLVTAKGAADEYGSTVRVYAAGEELIVDAPWKKKLADNFIAAGLAQQVKVVEPTETKQEAVSEPQKRGKGRS